MRQHVIRRLGSLALVALMVCAAALTVGAAGERAKNEKAAALPEKAAPKTGVTVYSNEKASVDASNLSDGYLMIKYTGGKNVRIKVQIVKSGSSVKYYYDLNNAGNVETFPLTEGDGTYSVSVLENTTETKYAQAYSTTVSMTLRNDFLPFLYPNQYVNYTADSKAVAKAAELCAGLGELDKVGKVFDFVVDNVTYDYNFAKEVSEGKHTGYLPTVDNTLATGKGICFDYAALMTAMLRSQNLPCKLVIGYAGQIYHAWINVYITGVGWVDKVIYFDGTNWTLMDPTFTSSGGRSDSIMKYVTTKSNYSQSFAY